MFKLLYCLLFVAIQYGGISSQPEDAQQINQHFYNNIHKLISSKYDNKAENEHSPLVAASTTTSRPPRPKEVTNWPSIPLRVGQITAVAINPDGNPVIFHRGDRIWNEESFDEANHYQENQEEPIKEDTILTISAQDGSILDGTGGGMFYLPHGMTIDHHGITWVTDVAMHQVFKFRPNSLYPSITLGQRFQPGLIPGYLCKPTAVAVASTGEFFVADGYCNSRIIKYNAAGRILRVIPQPPGTFPATFFAGNTKLIPVLEFLSLQVPHGLALLEHLDILCIADRENMRVVCPKAGLKSSKGEGTPAATIQEPDLGRVFDVAAYNDYVYAVNGPTSPMLPVQGFTIDPLTESIVDHWGEFVNPHSIAFCPNGSAMYVTEIGPNKITKFELK